MRSRPHVFWYSLALTLLLWLPLMAVVLFLLGQRQQQNELRQVAAARSGIAIEPGAQSTHRLLLVVQQEEPAFVLLRIDAPDQTMTFCGLPGTLLVNAPAGTTTLAECALAAGPGRAAQLLCATMATAETAAPALDYLAATPACWQDCAGTTATARFDTAALLPAARGGQSTVLELTTANVAEELAALQAALPGVDEQATARAAVWAAFARQDAAWLAGWPAALRQHSARTLTSLRAQDLAALADTLDYLAAAPGRAVDYTTAPTAPAPGGVALTEAGNEVIRELLQ